MDKHKEQQVEALVDRVMGETGLESPSKDFTRNLMSKIETQSVSEAVQYRPLLSKKALVAIVAVFIAAFILGLVYAPEDAKNWIPTFQFEPYFKKAWGWTEFYTSSKATLYAVLLFGVMFLVQIPWLKRYIERHGVLE
ncbi:MAG: hypothetical protein R2819_15255 [Allomuricauda sp.]